MSKVLIPAVMLEVSKRDEKGNLTYVTLTSKQRCLADNLARTDNLSYQDLAALVVQLWAERHMPV